MVGSMSINEGTWIVWRKKRYIFSLSHNIEILMCLLCVWSNTRFFFLRRFKGIIFHIFSKQQIHTKLWTRSMPRSTKILSLRHKNNLLSRRKDQIKKLKYPVTLNACKVIFQLVLKVLFWQKAFDLEWFCVPAAIKYPFGYKNLHGLTKFQYIYIYIYNTYLTI